VAAEYRFVAGVSPDASGAFFCGGSKDVDKNVESGYLTLVKTNLGFTHQGIEGCGWSDVSMRQFEPILER
jgi:hypothetical protein